MEFLIILSYFLINCSKFCLTSKIFILLFLYNMAQKENFYWIYPLNFNQLKYI
jgi:hypothetical protein